MTAETIEPFGRFFLDARDGEVVVPRCRSCGRRHWYPMERCPHCLSDDLDWAPVSPEGTVFSVTTVRYGFTAATRGRTPYGIALVELDDAPEVRLVCRTEMTETRSAVAIGDRVLVRVEPDAAEPGTGLVWCRAVG